ncbi:MAG TPA: aminomethyltransferase [Providencia sp.]|uniref:aminomethyl transferase family protein n=1 Tax=Providencia sp. TaxID=589 RepID=UPI000E977377|nr:aminomethyl transferase family protein [Providencia sp.]MBP6081508.1 aminomethyltransferase family protein [Providencia sp.]HBO24353.1 aminomethyltransferase [Providencia sp.]
MGSIVSGTEINGSLLDGNNQMNLMANQSCIKDEYYAVRNNVLLVDYSHYGIARVIGEDAWLLLNYMISADLSSIRDEQLLYGLFLDDLGEIISDLYVACDDESYLLVSEWLTGDALSKMVNDVIEKKRHEGEHYKIETVKSLNSEWGMLCVEGPYSWELLSEIFGLDIIGLPFHEHMHINTELILMRAGKHGEFCYHLLGEKAELDDAWGKILKLTDKYDLKTSSFSYLQDVRLENPCWDPDIFNVHTRCPIELQMQWVVSYDKEEFIGLEAIKERLKSGVTKRVIGAKIISDNGEKICTGNKVLFREKEIGIVINIGFSRALGQYIARLLIEDKYAYVDIDSYIIKSDDVTIKIVTSSIPFIYNLSLMISPIEHSYVDRTRALSFIE